MKFEKMKSSALIVSALLITSLASCNRKGCTDPTADNYSDKAKKDDGSCTYGASVADFETFFANNRANATQTSTVSGTFGGTVFGTDGTIIQFPANAFEDASGNPVTGTVTIELIEAIDPSDMMWLGLTTDTPSGLLVTGGEIKISASAGGSDVYLADGMSATVFMPYTDTPDPSMDLFDGTEAADGDVSWVSVTTTDSSFTTTPDTTGGWYTFEWSDSTLGWINCDYFWSDPSPKSMFDINVDGIHHWSNTLIFMHFPTLPALATAYWTSGDTDENSYNSGYEIPIGMEIDLVAVSEISGTYYSAITTINVSSGLVVDMSLTETTLADLEAAILAL